MTDQLIIVNGEGHFWQGWKFTPEYPDAKLFTRLAEAKAIASVIRRHRSAKVVAGYGLETEKVMA